MEAAALRGGGILHPFLSGQARVRTGRQISARCRHLEKSSELQRWTQVKKLGMRTNAVSMYGLFSLTYSQP